MAMVERTIAGVGDLIEALRKDRKPEDGAIWFRGQANAQWKLLPGYMRADSDISETTLLNRFRQSATMLAEHKPSSTFDWTFLMQHYGVPTRLLDWSESPLVALYFATMPELVQDADAVLWCLRPTILNRNANIVDKDEGAYIPSFDDEELSSYTTESVRQNSRIELYPVATLATRNNSRIQAQMGTFTIHHNKRVAIEDVGDRDHILKYVVPQCSKITIFDELTTLGINRFSLFPEMSSIGTTLKEMMA